MVALPLRPIAASGIFATWDKKESTSFLKKRSKKLLRLGRR
jgi:hypothetical protein